MNPPAPPPTPSPFIRTPVPTSHGTTPIEMHMPHLTPGPWLPVGLIALGAVIWLKWHWRPGAAQGRRISRQINKGISKSMRRNSCAGGGTRQEWDFGLVAMPGRFVSGKPMDGEWRTDSGWLHRGTLASGEGASASRWHLLSRLERAGIRLSAAAIAFLTTAGFITDEKGTLSTLRTSILLSATGVAAWASWRMVDAMLAYRHRRDWILPVHNVLRPIIGYPAQTRPEQYLSIPSNFASITGDAITVELPANYHSLDARNEQIKAALSSKLRLSHVEYSWRLAGANHSLVVKQLPRPRAKVVFSDPDILVKVKRAKESAPMLGLTHQDEVVGVDLDAESPHILVSASTGGGKSVITRTAACQILHNGGVGDILDVKRHSHKWARGLPNVRYFRDIADIHERLIELGEEAYGRNRIVDDWEGEESDAPVGPRRLVLIEEANALIRKLNAYWSRIREPKTDPKTSPAIDALAEILFMGRAVKFHVILVAQSATANALGGPEMRENFATRILARYTVNAWKMLVPEVTPIPKSSRHVGRAQVVLGGDAKETQILFFTPAEARAWATAGTITYYSGYDPDGAGAPVSQEASQTRPPLDESNSWVSDAPPLTLVPEQAEKAPSSAPISLSDAVKTKLVGLSLDAIRKASARDPEFPSPLGKQGKAYLYDPAALVRWERNRPRATGSAG